MTWNAVPVDLRLALNQPGCPICRLRSDSEARYIRSLLWESVNDSVTRGHFIGSLGYCPQHTWQIGLVEKERFGSPLGNAILYEHLSRVVQEQLAAYAHRMNWTRQKRRLHTFWHRSSQSLNPQELQPREPCRVCQMGEQAGQANLGWLVRGVSSGGSDDLRELYVTSDGLCFLHLRQALAGAKPGQENGARFLVESTLHRLALLRHDLSEFERKHAWDNRHEANTETEQIAWLRALAFFGGEHLSDNETGLVSPSAE